MSSIRFASLPVAAAVVLSVGLASPALAEWSKAGPEVAPAAEAVAKVVSPGMVGPEVVDDWDVADASVDAEPKDILVDLEAGEAANLVTVRIENGRPVIERITKGTKRAASREIRRQQADADVLAIELESEVQVMEEPVSLLLTNDPQRSELWGLDRLQAESVWPLADGTGVIVAVIDTGVARRPDQPPGALLRHGIWIFCFNRSGSQLDRC